MTCIVAIKNSGHTWIGGDSCGGDTKQYTKFCRSDSKIMSMADGHRRLLMGFTTSFRMGQLLKWELKKFLPETSINVSDEEYMNVVFINSIRKCFRENGFLKESDKVESGGEFLVCLNGEIYHIESDFQVGTYVQGYIAIGCGAEFALGSLFSTVIDRYYPPDKKIEQALMAAENFSAYVCRPWHILSSEEN